jgi:hypothetical protein
MTRNKHLYKIQCVINKKKIEVYYRDLTSIEYAFLTNLKNAAIRDDLAGRTAIYQMDPDKVPFGTRITIGRDVLRRVNFVLEDKQMFEVTINELREKIKKDDFLMAVKSIVTCLPGQSIMDLLNLTLIDILELVCLCELIIGKPLLEVGGFKKRGLVNTKTLPDDGKSLQEKMNALNSHLGN